jgi:uncharacterized damage-inducible protein DinB
VTEIERIQDQIRRTYEGDPGHEGEAWHGTPLRAILKTVNAGMAMKRVVPSVHTIWELVLHMTVWRRVVVRRIGGEPVLNLTPQEDWPRREDETEGAWQDVLAELDGSQQRLLAAVGSMPMERLNDQVPGHDYSFYVMLHGIVQHDIYHAGQIALIKKLLSE